ncbi:Zinc finger, B-box [Artemisia annua]|uniref:Zinc finger, B-box n=1 Tax=Artemisia annua TaxID=35608 RepID=A0A2U1LS52_ARTAN|nr:Zinc finger, B-box [Artemisia annua]
MTMKLTVVCDLCHKQQPCIYCSSDSAFLCFDCDLHVHSANFLVARHIRLPLCSLCKSYHDSRSCSGEEDDDALSSSSSNDCISSTDEGNSTKTTPKTKTTSSSNVSSSSSDWKTRNVLVNWCSRLGLSNSASKVIIEAAFQVWWNHRSRVWPYRVALAASLWLGLLRFTNNNYKRTRMSTLLKRLEDISGVPAKSIVIAQSKLAATSKMMKRPCEDNVEESWAEC